MVTPMPRSHHIGFTVTSLDRPIAMFSSLFGYTLTSRGSRNPRGVAMLTGVEGADIEVAHLHRDGCIGVELIAYAAPGERGQLAGRPCDSGYTHLTFEVADIDALIVDAARYGLRPLGRIVGRTGSQRVVYLRDPDGIAIELIEPG